MVQSAQNMMLSPAASDLGLGDQLSLDVEEKLAEQKKKRQRDMAAGFGSPATMSLFGTVGGING